MRQPSSLRYEPCPRCGGAALVCPTVGAASMLLCQAPGCGHYGQRTDLDGRRVAPAPIAEVRRDAQPDSDEWRAAVSKIGGPR